MQHITSWKYRSITAGGVLRYGVKCNISLLCTLSLTCKTPLVYSCGRPYIKLSHGEGSIDKGDRIPRSGMLLVSFLSVITATPSKQTRKSVCGHIYYISISLSLWDCLQPICNVLYRSLIYTVHIFILCLASGSFSFFSFVLHTQVDWSRFWDVKSR